MIITEHEWGKLKGSSDRDDITSKGCVSKYKDKYRAHVWYQRQQEYLGLFEEESHGWMAIEHAKKILKRKGKVTSLNCEVRQFVKKQIQKSDKE